MDYGILSRLSTVSYINIGNRIIQHTTKQSPPYTHIKTIERIFFQFSAISQKIAH